MILNEIDAKKVANTRALSARSAPLRLVGNVGFVSGPDRDRQYIANSGSTLVLEESSRSGAPKLARLARLVSSQRYPYCHEHPYAHQARQLVERSEVARRRSRAIETMKAPVAGLPTTFHVRRTYSEEASTTRLILSIVYVWPPIDSRTGLAVRSTESTVPWTSVDIGTFRSLPSFAVTASL